MATLKYWLWLTELPGLTNQTRLALLQHFPTPEDVYYAEAEEVLLKGKEDNRKVQEDKVADYDGLLEAFLHSNPGLVYR